MATTRFTYDVPFQARMVRTMFQDPDFAQSVAGLLSPEHFEKRVHRWHAKEILDYIGEHRVGISKSALQINAERSFKGGRLQRKRDTKAVKAFQEKLSRKVKDKSYLKEEVFRFVKNQVTKETILNGVEHLKVGDFEAIDREFQKVVEVRMAPEGGAGGFLVGHSQQRMERRINWVKDGVQTGIEVDEYMKPGGLPPQQLGAIIAPPAAGKCLAPSTLIRRYDGSLVQAKDVRVGDELLGPDSEPKTVLGTATGTDKMYRVTPTAGLAGNGFECNHSHVLTLHDYYTGGVLDVPLSDYLTWSKDRKRRAKFVRPEMGVLFRRTNPLLGINPWLLGLWYAEGNKDLKGFRITTPDEAIVKKLKREATKHGLRLVPYNKSEGTCPTWGLSGSAGSSNPLTVATRRLHTDGSRLPTEILFGSWHTRAEFLAGWVDGDGSSSRAYTEVTTKHKDWARDLVDLARSLGLRAGYKRKPAKITDGSYRDYWRVSFTRTKDLRLPLVLERKQADIPTSVCDTFKVKALGEGEYAGFTLDGDGRFLLADYTVTHNSNTLVHIGKSAVMLSQQPVLHFSFELAKHVIEDRYDSAFTGIKLNSLEDKGNPKKIHRFMQQLGDDLQGEPLVVQDYPAGTMTVLDLALKVRQLESRAFYPGLIICDAAYLMKPIAGYTGNKYEDIGRVYIELRALAHDLNVPIWTAGQGNKASLGKEIVTMRELADSFQQAMHADVLLALCQTDEEKDRRRARFFMMKNRNGIAEFEVPVTLDWSAPRIKPRGGKRRR